MVYQNVNPVTKVETCEYYDTTISIDLTIIIENFFNLRNAILTIGRNA